VGVGVTVNDISFELTPPTTAYSIHVPISALLKVPEADQWPDQSVFGEYPKYPAGVQEEDGSLVQRVTGLFGWLEAIESVQLLPTLKFWPLINRLITGVGAAETVNDISFELIPPMIAYSTQVPTAPLA
jgi:hypothetical protein